MPHRAGDEGVGQPHKRAEHGSCPDRTRSPEALRRPDLDRLEGGVETGLNAIVGQRCEEFPQGSTSVGSASRSCDS